MAIAFIVEAFVLKIDLARQEASKHADVNGMFVNCVAELFNAHCFNAVNHKDLHISVCDQI